MFESAILYSLAILGALGFSAIYSLAETSITSIPFLELHRLKVEKHPAVKTIEYLRAEKEMFLGTMLIASTALDTLASAIAISFAVEFGGINWIPVATMLMTVAIVLIADIIPKTYAFEHPAKTAVAIARITKISVQVLYPITKIIQYIVQLFFKVFKVKDKRINKVSGDMLLRGAIDMGYSMGYLLNYKKQMLDGILDLSKFTVKEVMTKYDKVYSFNISTPPDKLLRLMLKTGHSRFPVWKGDSKHVVGMLYLKDFFNLMNVKPVEKITVNDIEDIMYDPWFINTSTTLINQLKEFRKKKVHFAIVANDKGENVGIISLEDILEEIVGNIDDEHDFSRDIEKQRSGKILLKASLPIKDLNERLGYDLPDKEFITIGNLIANGAGNNLSVGTKVKIGEVDFKITKLIGKKVTEIEIGK